MRLLSQFGWVHGARSRDAGDRQPGVERRSRALSHAHRLLPPIRFGSSFGSTEGRFGAEIHRVRMRVGFGWRVLNRRWWGLVKRRLWRFVISIPSLS
jgi:hypothetical protein